MRTVLHVGSYICCGMGLFIICASAIGIAEFGMTGFHDDKYIYAIFTVIAYTGLAFAPLFLFKSAIKEPNGNWRFILVGTIEAIVFAIFVGMFFPKP